MKPVFKRTLSAALAAALTLGCAPVVNAVPLAGSAVYDEALNMREEHFLSGVKFTDGEAGFTGDEWYDESEVIGINRERAKSQFISYHSTDAALAAEKSVMDNIGPETSEFYQLLSGKDWDFALVENPAEAEKVDAQYLAKEYTGDAFQPEYVPQAWQTYRNEDGTFKYDEPMYTNHSLPWFGNFEPQDYNNPHAPTQYNPVGYYRTTFTVPENWDGREIFISFQSVESAYYLYVNGHKVGYSTDAFTAHDFNITPYLEAGENTIALKVFRWSIGSWLENQDFIRQSGIYRDVYLYSKDEAEIRDFFVKTQFVDRTSVDSDVNVTVETDLRALHNEQAGTYTLSARILDNNNQEVAAADDQTVTLNAAGTFEEKLRDAGTTVTSTMKVTNPAKWFPDTPNLYSLVLELKDAEGNVMESVVERIGFREIYKVDITADGREQMQITGRQMILRGVNRHDTDLEYGHALRYEDYLTDLTLMKQHNLNAIRTAHYPNDKVLYSLADELGIYVCAEANIESHRAASYGAKVPTGTGQGMPEWVATVTDRVATNLEMYKNNPSVVMWSLGNEATYSYAPLNENYGFWVASMYLLARDPSRLRKYERESENYQHPYVKTNGQDPWSVDVRKNNIVDIHSTQYVLPDYVAGYNGRMPFIHSEYNHAMGLSYGNAKEHWDAIRQNDKAQGGFIWDYVDQSIRTVRYGTDGTKEEFWGYGGDWIDKNANDDAFCGNGMLFADRTPTPKMTEAKKVHQQVNFYADSLEAVPGGTLSLQVVNEYENTSLDAFSISWELWEDGIKKLGGDDLNLTAPAMKGKSLMTGDHVEDFSIELPMFEAMEGRDYLLNISVRLKEGNAWAEKDYEIAGQQFQLTLPGTAQEEAEPTTKEFTKMEQLGSRLTLEGMTDNNQKFTIVLDTAKGIILSYSLDGTLVMTQGPEQSLYRAETYNDTTVGKDGNLKNAGSYENLSNVEVAVTQDNSQVLMAMSGSMKVDASALMAYQIYGNGEIVVLSQFLPNSNFAPNGLPKIGGRMMISGEFDNLTYYGRGPEENYVDRKSGYDVGVYQSVVYDYANAMGADSTWDGWRMLKPQENGNRTDIRWTALTNDEGVGLMVTGSGLLESSVAHYTAEDMNAGTYNNPTYRHPGQVPQREEIVWNIDLHQNGVSDTAFMGHKPLDGYFFPTNQSYSYSYRISPVNTKAPETLMAESHKPFAVPSSSYPITGIYINDNPVAGFDVNSETGASYTLAADESIEKVTVDGTSDFTVTYNEDGTMTVSAVNNYGQEFSYQVKLSREGKELDRTAVSTIRTDNNYNGQPGSNMIDGNAATIWHSNWSDSSTSKLSRLWFMAELTDPTAINGIRYLPRSDSNNFNGAYGEHDIYISNSDKPLNQLSTDPNSADWTKVGSGSWAKSSGWKNTAFDMTEAKYILVMPRSTHGDTPNAWGSGAEFRVTTGTQVNGQDVTVTLEERYEYQGGPVRPAPQVTLDGQTLILGVDYTLTYADNEAPGEATLTVNFCGAFQGAPITKSFTIADGTQRTLTLVVGGETTTQQVYAGETVTLDAGEDPADKMFDRWTSNNAQVKFQSAISRTTTFVMPDADVTVTAEYVEAYTVTVVGGFLDEGRTITSQKYKVGSGVTLYADEPEGKLFDHWTTDGQDAHITDPARTPALLESTPARDVTVTAHYRTDESFFKVVDKLPDHRYLGTTFTPPETLAVIQGDQQTDAQVTWNEGQVAAINNATTVSILPLTGTIGEHTVSTQVAVVPGNVVYFVDSGAESFSSLAQAIMKHNAGTLLNQTPDQLYDAESGWGCTNDESQVETNVMGDVTAYSTIRNMTDGKGEEPNDGRGKPLTYRFDNLEAGTYQVYVGYQNIWYQTTWQRNATIELLQGEIVLATTEKNLNSETPANFQMAMTLTEAGSVELKMTPKETANANNDMLVSFIVIVKDGEIVEPQTYPVTVNVQGQGTASANVVNALPGETVTLTAQAETGWHFVRWESQEVTVENNTFTMPDKAVTVTAVFEQDHTHSYGKPTFQFSEDGKSAKAVFACGCGDEQEVTAEVSAKVKTEATCTEMGVTTYTATVTFGGETYSAHKDVADIPMTDHKTELTGKKEPTCTEPGYTGDRKCSDCGTVVEKGEEIPALGHNFVDGKCTRCGAVDPDYTEPTNPTEPSDPTKPTDPSEPTNPTEPTKPTNPSEPTEPTESSEPTQKPTQTTKPATDPEGPDQTGESFRPVLLATLLLISAACLGVILVQTRKWKVR